MRAKHSGPRGWKQEKVTNLKPFVIIGPLLGDGLKRGTPKALKGLPLSLLFCLFVCLLTRYRSQFSTQQPIFFYNRSIFFIAMGKKDFLFFPKFSFLTFLGPFFTFFSVFPSLPLYWPQITPFDLQIKVLACRLIITQKEPKKNFFFNFHF